MHRWDLTPREAIALQNELREKVVREGSIAHFKTVAGCDVSYSRKTSRLYAGVVCVRIDGLEVVEESWAVREAEFPYVPGLLSFREAPAVIEAFEKLRCKPHVLIADGQGVAHPRRFGLASHLGVVLGVPSVGCAKSLLCGECDEPTQKKGSSTRIIIDRECVGLALRTREGTKPVYVSIGHRVSLNEAKRLVLKVTTRYRLPEPTRLAHRLVNSLRTNDCR